MSARLRSRLYSRRLRARSWDHNLHTNNIKYADMAYNAAELPDKMLSRMIINFVAETRLNDKIDIAVENSDNEYLFTGFKDTQPCFTAKLLFEE